MSTAVLSVRVRRELKDFVDRNKDVNWKELIERLIEDVKAQKELEEAIKRMETLHAGLPPSPEPAWKTIRELRESR